MSDRILPKKGTPESLKLLELWDKGTHDDKKNLCDVLGVSYSRAKHVIPTYREQYLPNPEDVDGKITGDMPWAEQIEVFKNMDKLVSLHHKVSSEVNVFYDTKLPIGVTYSADWQLGQPGVDYDSFREDMKLIKSEPGLYVDIGGDAIENIIQASKVGSSHNQIPIAPQVGLYALTLKMLRPKINTVKTGNHQYWTASLTGEDWLNEFCRNLKVVYIKHGARVNLQVGDICYPYATRHSGRFNSSFNPTHSNKQHQRMDFPWARVTVIEHNHVGSVEQYRYNDQECIAIRTGTYAVYDDRSKQFGYFGSHVCNPTVIFFPNEDRMVGFKDLRDGVDFLRYVRKEAL